MGFWDGSGISWTVCKQSAPRSKQITTPTHHHSTFTGECSSWRPTHSVPLKATITRAVDQVAGRASSPQITQWWNAGVVTCLERGADLHMAQLMPLPLTVSCFRKIQNGFTILVPAHPGSCVCVLKQQNCNVGNSRVATSSAKISNCQRRLQSLPVITAVCQL